MPQQTKIFRVFVSSTFTDMKEERKILQREVFPKLEKFCEERGARFQGVDLRWGVNEELQLEQKTLQTCFNEIERCQKISPKPNFLILLGNKYGWQPIPEKIPCDEMDQIILHLTEDEKVFLIKEDDKGSGWYRRDNNAVPPEYVLQPREKQYKEYTDWEKKEAKIRNLLRTSVAKLDFTDKQKIKYFASATHQEIINGALNPPKGTEKPEEHVFAFIRNTKGLPDDITAKGYIDLIIDPNNAQSIIADNYSKNQLSELKNQLHLKLDKNYISYEAEWRDAQTIMKNPKGFADEIYSRLEKIIEQQLGEVVRKEEVEHEVRLHDELKQRLTEHFCGRTNILQTIKDYLGNNSEQRTMTMIGASGSGKSSVMAKAINECKEDKKNAIIVYRFLGTTSSSSNIISLLQSICRQIAEKFGKNLEELAGEGRKDSIHDLYTMSELFRKCLALATPGIPVVVFLDALDQLSDSDNAKALSWLPNELPENARLVVSALPELGNVLNSTYTNQLDVLPVAEATAIIERWCGANKRILTPEQSHFILNKFKIEGLPIYLKLAFEKAKEWHHYTNELKLKDDVPGVINDFFDLLNEKHHPEFVKHAVYYMLCGRYQGLTENEILEVLAFDNNFWKEIFLEKITHPAYKDELVAMKKALEESNDGTQSMKIPIVLWSRLFLDLEPFLAERDADGVPIITFFHRQFNEVLRERYEL